MGGDAGRYWWGQNEKEIIIKCRVARSVKARNVALTALSQKVRLVVNGEVICDGPLHRPVIADETLYTIEEMPGDEKKVRASRTEWRTPPAVVAVAAAAACR